MALPTDPAGISDEIRQRYLKLYTGAIADMLDKNGYRRQVLPHYVTPFTSANRVAGPADRGGRVRMERVKVELGARNDRDQEIKSGLREGDRVLIKPPSADANEWK